MRTPFRKTISRGLLLWISVAIAFGETPSQENAAKESFEVTATEIRLPGVTVDRETLEVRIEAIVCLTSGILEYVVCKPGTFEHETIFTTEAQPEIVHAALLLGGLKPTPQLAGLADLWWKKALKRKESQVRIEVEWEQDGGRKRANLTSMLKSREEDTTREKSAPREAWVFAGSFLGKHPETGESFYAANSSGIMVGIWPDPSAVIQYGIASGNPYDGEGFGMEIDEKRVPALGTRVTLVFSLYFPAEKKTPAAGEGDPAGR